MRITTPQLVELLERSPDVQLVDVRTPSEFSAGHIPEAVNIPMDEVDARLADIRRDKPVVLICQSGGRAQITCNLISAQHPSLLVLEGGTRAWLSAGLPVVTSAKTRWSLERQVRLAAGLLVLTGVLLSQLVNSSWIFLSGFVGLGLTFAGLTDICPMGILFMHMPWNKGKATVTGQPCPAAEVRS